MNAFDGALTALGVIIGAWTSGPVQPRTIIGAGLGVSLAMGISGFSGTYFVERAERLRKLEELEHSLLMDLHHSVHVKAQRTAMIWAGLLKRENVNGAFQTATKIMMRRLIMTQGS